MQTVAKPSNRSSNRVVWDPKSFVSFDLETHLASSTILAPRMVCGSVARYAADGTIEAYLLYPREEVFEVFEALLDDPTITIVVAYGVYDMGVMLTEFVKLGRHDVLEKILRAYREDRIYDVIIAQAEDAIAGGHLGMMPDGVTKMRKPSTGEVAERYSLEVVVHQVLGRRDAKDNDDWRLRYGELDGVPLNLWAPEARQYPVDDARNTLEAAVAQVTGIGKRADENGGWGCRPGPHRNLEDVADQCRAHWAAHLAAMEGIPVDKREVESYAEETEIVRSKAQREAHAAGLLYLKGTKKALAAGEGTLSKDTKEIKRRILIEAGGLPCTEHGEVIDPNVLTIKERNKLFSKDFAGEKCGVCEGTGISVPEGVKRTPKDGIETSREVLEDQDDPDLRVLVEIGRTDKATTTYIPYLRGADPTIHPRPNVLLVTGRSSYDGAMQQMPRKGRERACMVAGPGMKMISIDFAGIEAVAFSQVEKWLTGRSVMGEAIVAGKDIHSVFASTLMGKKHTWQEIKKLAKEDPESECGRMRQIAKNSNFGLLGSMGALTFVTTARRATPPVIVCRLFGNEICKRVMVKSFSGRFVQVCAKCLEIATDLKRVWYDDWQVKPFFDRVSEIIENGHEVPTLVPDEIREGGVLRFRGADSRRESFFSAGCNNFFQSLAAAGAKAAFWELTEACWGLRNEALFGYTPRFFMHDQFLLIGPEEIADAAAAEASRIMVETMQRYVPDIAPGVKVESSITNRWVK